MILIGRICPKHPVQSLAKNISIAKFSPCAKSARRKSIRATIAQGIRLIAR
jgi:hypothetical protein